MSLVYARGREKLVDYRRVMEILGVGKTKAYELMHSGELGEVYRVGASLRVAECRAKDFLERCRVLINENNT